jgi:hypothetical protein
MLKSTLIAGGLALLMFNTTPRAAELDQAGAMDLEPAINGGVSAQGLFPEQGMEEAFEAYLAWTKEQGLSRLAAFEAVERDLNAADQGMGSMSGRFPNQGMEERFKDYLAWASEGDSRLFYAFRAVDFD